MNKKRNNKNIVLFSRFSTSFQKPSVSVDFILYFASNMAAIKQLQRVEIIGFAFCGRTDGTRERDNDGYKFV